LANLQSLKVPAPDQDNGTANAGHAEEEDLRATEESTTSGAIADDEQLEARVAKLDSIIFQCRARRREASVEAGRAFIELKALLGHGKWKKHFEETFASWIELRTAERYMKRARKEDALLKNDSVSNFDAATDRGAMERREASRHAQAEVAAVSKRDKVNSRRIYRLPLRMRGNEQSAAEALQKLPNWSRAEKKIVRLLRSLCVKYKAVDKDYWRQS
jgi:hypothetical protein